MEFFAGTLVLTLGWGIAVFVLWNLHRFGKAFSRAFFWKTAAGLTLAAVAIFSVLYFRQRSRAAAPPRAVIFPIVEKSSGSARLTAQGLALADVLAAELRERRTGDFYALAPAAVFDFANSDSLIFAEYAIRFAHGVDLPFAGFGEYLRANGKLNLRLQWLATTRHEAVWQTTIVIEDSAQIADAMAGVAAKLADFLSLHGAHAGARSAVAKLPPSQQSQYYAAYFDFLQHRWPAAVQQAEALAESDTAQPLFRTLAARARMQLLRQQRAHDDEWKKTLNQLVPALQRAVQLDSSYAPALLTLGECYVQAKKWREAEVLLRRARAVDPTCGRTYVDMAQLHRSRFAAEGFHNELELYQRALQVNPLALEALLGAVEYELHAQRRPEALALLEKYQRLNPEHVAVLLAQGRIYIEQGNIEKALPTFETLLRHNAQSAEVFYNLGIAYFHQNDLERAQRAFERALQLSNYADAQLYLAQISGQRGDTSAAISHLRARIRASTGEEDVYAAEARKQLYRLLLSRGEIPSQLLPDTTQTKK